MASRQTSVVKNLLLAVSSFCIAILTLAVGYELVERVRYERWRASYDNGGNFGRITIPSPNPVLMWEYKPYGERPDRPVVRTNRWGFRERDYDRLEKPEGTDRIAFIGDSVTLGFYVEPGEGRKRRQTRVRVAGNGRRVQAPEWLRIADEPDRRESMMRAAFADPEMFDSPLLRLTTYPMRPAKGSAWDTIGVLHFPVPVQDEPIGLDVAATLTRGIERYREKNQGPILERAGKLFSLSDHLVRDVAHLVAKMFAYNEYVIAHVSNPRSLISSIICEATSSGSPSIISA